MNGTNDFSDLATALDQVDLNRNMTPEQVLAVTTAQAHPPYTAEQIEFMRRVVVDRESMALLAPAGYGKSIVAIAIASMFRTTLEDDRNRGRDHASPVALCAFTKLAATNINGRTVHSYLGIGIAIKTAEELARDVMSNRAPQYLQNARRRCQALQVLIIDEINGISAELMDKISEYLKRVRGNNDPFGGVQIVAVGDFYQLQPMKGDFAFNSDAWHERGIVRFELTHSFRHEDQALIDMLNELRVGECSDESLELLREQTEIDEKYANGLLPTRLFPKKEQVEKVNKAELKNISGDHNPITTYSIRFTDLGQQDPRRVRALRESRSIPEAVDLAVGAPVIITSNDNDLVNGMQGKVLEVDNDSVTIQLNTGKRKTVNYVDYTDPATSSLTPIHERVLFRYMPLLLAYALTIHRAQYMNIKLLDVDLDDTFCHGQAYVAISRIAGGLRGLRVRNATDDAFICDDRVREFYANI